MNEQPLTPTYSRTHAPAKYLLQSRVVLKELLSGGDIEFLFTYEEEPPLWAMSAPQKNSNTDRFLSGLAITKWDVAEFVQALADGFCKDFDFEKWLAAKPPEWHQRLYSLLFKEFGAERDFNKLHDIKIVRLNNGSYGIGSKCFFPSGDNPMCSAFPTVDIGVYTTGTSKAQQEGAFNFLKRVGVQELELEHIVQAILDERYTKEAETPDQKLHLRDLRQFFVFLVKNPDHGGIFSNYFILMGSDKNWHTPDGLYIDSPYVKTELSVYYRLLTDDSPRRALSRRYLDSGISLAKLRKFAIAVGVRDQLCVESAPSGVWSHHPSRGLFLKAASSGKSTCYGVNEDWTLPNLEKILTHPSQVVAKLIWNAMRNANRTVLKARYSCNRSSAIHEEDSSLVILLKSHSWVPQSAGVFVKPAQASKNKLPKGFPFDSGDAWLKAVHFGEDEEKRSEEHRKKESIAPARIYCDFPA